MDKKLKCLVTGGAGFIGTNLIKELLEYGYEVHSLDNYDSGLRSNEVDGCNYIELDIDQIYLMDDDFDVVFHLAALSRIQPSFEYPSETFRVNVMGTEQVLEWAKETNTKVVYAGSSSMHHNPEDSPYATYKWMGESICKLYKKSFGVDVQIARFYNVYGPSEIVDGDWAAVLGIWRNQIEKNIPITIVGDGDQRRDFTHVSDIVDGLIRLSQTDIQPTDAWELGSGINYSINELFDMFEERYPGLEKVYIPEQTGNYRKTLRVDNETLNLLNWKPTDQLKTYIQSL